jgi:hypothetical protein
MSVPTRIANGAGNIPDASQLMDDYDFLEAFGKGSYLSNGGMECWSNGTSFTNPADAAAILDYWSLEKGGTSGATADITREATTKETGSYAVKVNITGAGSANSYLRLKQSQANYLRFAGKTVTFGMSVYASTASKVRLSLYDGTTTTYSDYHTGAGGWAKLTASATLAAAPSEITTKVAITSDFTGAVYFDSAFMYVITSAASATAKAALAYFAPDDQPFAGTLGTGTNDDAAAGYVGEYIEAYTDSKQNAPTSGQYGDTIHIDLTPGDWRVTQTVWIEKNSATITDGLIGIGTTTGNSSAGLSPCKTQLYISVGAVIDSATIPNWRTSLSAATTYYGKIYLSYTGGTPQYYMILSATRVR